MHYEILSTKNIPFEHTCFFGYPDKTYLTKLSKLNRPALCAVTDDDLLIGCLVMTKSCRAVKISLLAVHPLYQQRKIGYELMRQVIMMLTDDFCDCDLIYSVCPHQFNTDNYQDLLLQFGFQITSIKANGDILYTYAKSI